MDKTTLQHLRDRGFKLTKVRRFIIQFLSNSKKPLAASEILLELGSFGENVNKTTVYRELHFLVEEGILREIQLHDDQKRYEAAHAIHHHHLVCTSCNRVDEVDSIALERELKGLEEVFNKHKDFALINHNLEFFGLCNACR